MVEARKRPQRQHMLDAMVGVEGGGADDKHEGYGDGRPKEDTFIIRSAKTIY